MLALARHAEAFGEPVADGVRIRATAADVAQEVGAQEATAQEVMARLKRLRLVREEPAGTSLVVSDIARLRDFLEFLEMPQKFAPRGADLNEDTQVDDPSDRKTLPTGEV